MDKLSRVVNLTFQTLQLHHPYRTALGSVLGMTAYVLINIFSPLLHRFSYLVDLSQMTFLGCALIGITLLHLPNLLKMFFRPKDLIFDENLDIAFRVIEEAKVRGHLSERKVGDLYLQLCERYLKNVEIKTETRKERG